MTTVNQRSDTYQYLITLIFNLLITFQVVQFEQLVKVIGKGQVLITIKLDTGATVDASEIRVSDFGQHES